MEYLFVILGAIFWVVNFACFIVILIRMFKSGDTILGIICIISIFCLLGGVIAFILGWINAPRYRSEQLMKVWTGAVIGAILTAFFAQNF